MNIQELKDGLEKALELGGEGYTLFDLECELASGHALLWRGNKSAIVTRLHKTDSYFYLHVWLGTGDLSELLTLEPGISAWARARGCKYASINGRKGWTKMFKPFGFKPEDGELRKYYEQI